MTVVISKTVFSYSAQITMLEGLLVKKIEKLLLWQLLQAYKFSWPSKGVHGKVFYRELILLRMEIYCFYDSKTAEYRL